MVQLTFIDFFLGVIYLLIFITYFTFIFLTKKEENKVYNYLLPGYLFKVFAAIFFLLIYIYYYGGGDTIGYYKSAECLVNLSFKNPKVYLSILFGNTSIENFSYFDVATGYPWYYGDPWSFFVVRMTSLFVFLGFKSILSTTILVATFTFSGSWYLFKFLTSHYPSLIKQISVAILFYPSVAFWGAGILKDSYTLAASFFLFVALFQVLIYKKRILKNVVLFFIAFFFLIKIKPYIFFLEIAAFSVIFIYSLLKIIKNRFFRVLLFPIIIVVTFTIASWVYFSTASAAGGFYTSVNDMIEMMVVKQRDLTQEYYGGNNFNIGYFAPTIPGILSKFFPATIAGLFRPFLWESRSVVMLLSGIEDFLVLLFSVIVAVRFLFLSLLKGFKAIKFFMDPFVVYSFVYSLLFAFVVGLITANFGALVRYRIPFTPFYLLMLFILYEKLHLAKKVSGI